MKKNLLLLTLALVIIGIISGTNIPREGKENNKKGQIVQNEGKIFTSIANNPAISVLYDNNPYRKGLTTAWGFSCLIRGTEKNILFDTGGDGTILLANMGKSGINPKEIDLIVLSHIHGDHVGGLHSILEKNHDVVVYLPESFPKSFKDGVHKYGATVVEVREPLMICKGVYTTGELGTWIKEQSLIINTGKGLILITGCSHPGIINIVNKAKALVKSDVLLVMGGFHLFATGKDEIEKIILSFRRSGVRFVGPCHCSGDNARALFKKEYGNNYINVGVGRVITMDDLK